MGTWWRSGAAHSRLLLGLGAFVFFLAVYLPTVSVVLVNTDVAANDLTAWQIAHTGRPWMEDLRLDEAGKIAHYGPGRDGHVVTTRTPGQIWAAVPFYVGSSEVQRQHGFRRGGMAAATLSAAAMAFFLLALLRSRLPASLSVGATLVLGLATPVWSVSADALWTHPVTVAGIAGAAWALATGRFWWTGIALGLAMTARLHVGLIAAVVGLGMAWTRRDPRVAVKVAVPTLVSVAGQAVWNKYVFDTWDPRGAYSGRPLANVVPGVGAGTDGFLRNLLGFMASPDRGMLVWTPILVLLLPAVIRGWRKAPTWSVWLAIGGLAYLVAQVGLNVFHGGDAFYGYRLGLETLVCWAPLYTFTAPRAGRVARVLMPVVVGLQAGAFFVGSVFEAHYLAESMAWHDNVLWFRLRHFGPGYAVMFAVVTLVAAMLCRHWQRAGTSAPQDRKPLVAANDSG